MYITGCFEDGKNDIFSIYMKNRTKMILCRVCKFRLNAIFQW